MEAMTRHTDPMTAASPTDDVLFSADPALRVSVLSGGVGGARFLQGVQRLLASLNLTERADVTVIANTGDDIWMHGLKVCPDLDTVMYTLGGGIDTERGWGRTDESWRALDELKAYGVEPTWFGLGDRDLATHLVRTEMMAAGYPLSQVTEALCVRWQPGVRLLPMTDDRVETHVVIDDPTDGQRKAVHFQEYWIRHQASVPAHSVVPIGVDKATPAPGVLDAIAAADIVLLPPSNPIVSIGTILAVPGIREALRATSAPVVGISGIIGGDHVRGMARQLLEALDLPVSAGAVAQLYGARSAEGILDAWLVDTSDAQQVAAIEAAGIRCRAIPLWMSDHDATAEMARAAFDLAAVPLP